MTLYPELIWTSRLPAWWHTFSGSTRVHSLLVEETRLGMQKGFSGVVEAGKEVSPVLHTLYGTDKMVLYRHLG